MATLALFWEALTFLEALAVCFDARCGAMLARFIPAFFDGALFVDVIERPRDSTFFDGLAAAFVGVSLLADRPAALAGRRVAGFDLAGRAARDVLGVPAC